MTVSNVSARNISGQTLHAAFGYSDEDGKLIEKNVELIKEKNYDALIVDEIGIVSSKQLAALSKIKEILNIPVLCFGVFKQ